MPSITSAFSSRRRGLNRAGERGALLIVALILCAIIGVSLVSYLKLGRTSMNVANRALYNSAAMNLAENGLEEAMYAINKKVANSSYDWGANGWTTASPVPAGDARRRLPATGYYNFDQGVTGYVRIYAYGYNGAAPRVVARSTVTIPNNSRPIEKWVEIDLRKTSKFANGLVAKDSLRFSGNNASVDSWHSSKNDDGTLRASPIAYPSALPYTTPNGKHDKGTIGSVSVAVDAVLVQNADIWGYAATGGALPSVGNNGVVGPWGTPTGTMDMNRVSTDFSTSFDPVAMPATGINLGSIGATTTLGLVGTTTTFTYTDVTLAASKQLNIVGNVTLLLTSTTDAIKISGNAGINIAAGSTLTIYTAGNIDIAGNGVLNGTSLASTANLPSSFQVWGTKTSGTQTIGIAGNGVLSGVVYAPQGSVKINGNGDVSGSIVANDITVVGNAQFHYDEALGDFGGTNPFRVSTWRELTTAAARNAITTLNW